LKRLKLDMEEAHLIYTQFKDNIEAQEIIEPLEGDYVAGVAGVAGAEDPNVWSSFMDQCATELETEGAKNSIKKTGEELENLYTTVTQKLFDIATQPQPEIGTGVLGNGIKFTQDLKDVKTVVSKEILTPVD
jgi:hypothetical protein